MKILGISAFYHDSAAVIIENGIIIAAVQEERFSRVKHDARFPQHAIQYCLEQSGSTLNDIDYIVFFEKPFLKFERLLETYLSVAPSGLRSFMSAMTVWLKEKLFQKKTITNELKKIQKDLKLKNDLLFSEHHLSHAASAFYPSQFDEAIVLTLDGVGEWATTTVSIGRGKDLKIIKEIHFPHSLGLLYSAFTYYTGFKVNSGEYKVMGLAPYGKPIYKEIILKEIVSLKDDGSFHLNQDYFDYCTGLKMTNDKFSKLFGRDVRKPDIEPIEQFHMDIAASVQKVIEEIVLKIVTHLKDQYKIDNLCLAGGVALNCVANGKIVQNKIFKNVWIQPAAGDAGGALGAALMVWHQHLNKGRDSKKQDSMMGSFLGPEFTDQEIQTRLTKQKAKFHILTENELIEKTATALSQEKAVGWFNGKMEFGPRALGARSIIGDPRSSNMQKELNLKVKFRESFRPFAPSILREHLNSWFNLNIDSPYMLLVTDVHDDKQIPMSSQEQKLFGMEKLNIVKSEVPAITHVDYSARIQTVHKNTNPKYHMLIEKFHELTGCPILVNTSFNVRGEPIVCTPEDAFHCFMGTNLDILVCGNQILYKHEQDKSLAQDYTSKYQLD